MKICFSITIVFLFLLAILHINWSESSKEETFSDGSNERQEDEVSGDGDGGESQGGEANGDGGGQQVEEDRRKNKQL